MNKFCLSEKHAERPTTRNPICRRTVPEWRTNFSLPLLGNVRTNSPSRRIVSEDFQPGQWGHVVFAEASRSFSLAAIVGAICYGAALVDIEAPLLKT